MLLAANGGDSDDDDTGSSQLDTAVSLDTCLALLRLSHFDPSIFRIMAPALQKQLQSPSDADRAQWRTVFLLSVFSATRGVCMCVFVPS